MAEQSLAVRLREEKGKEAARRLRKQGLIPAVVYGHREEAIPVTLNPQQLAKALRGGGWRWLTIPPGGSAAYNQDPKREKPPASANGPRD